MRAPAHKWFCRRLSSLYPLFAQDKGKSAADTLHAGASSSVTAGSESQSTSENEKRRILHRIGPYCFCLSWRNQPRMRASMA